MEKVDDIVDGVGTLKDLYHNFSRNGTTFVQVGASPSFAMVYEISSRMFWPAFLGGAKRKCQLLILTTEPKGLRNIAEWTKQGKLKAIVDELFDIGDKWPVRALEKLKTGCIWGKIVVRVAR